MLNLWQVFCQDSQNEKGIQIQRTLCFRTARKQIQPAKHKTMGCLTNLFYVYCVLGTILGSGDEHWIR